MGDRRRFEVRRVDDERVALPVADAEAEQRAVFDRKLVEGLRLRADSRGQRPCAGRAPHVPLIARGLAPEPATEARDGG